MDLWGSVCNYSLLNKMEISHFRMDRGISSYSIWKNSSPHVALHPIHAKFPNIYVQHLENIPNFCFYSVVSAICFFTFMLIAFLSYFDGIAFI